jgi:hypothetical protein
MGFFTQVFGIGLYLAAQSTDDRGYLALVLPQNVDPPGPEIELNQALHDESLSGNFVFSAAKLGFADADAAQSFVTAVNTVVSKSPAYRAFLWLTDPSNITSDTAPLMGISGHGTQVNAGLQAPITLTLSLQIQSGIELTLDDTILRLSGGSSSYQIQFVGPSSPTASNVTSGTLPFTGAQRGCIQFKIFLQRRSLNDYLHWGFQFLFPIEGQVRPALSEWLPLARGSEPNPTDMIGFQASIDPSDVLNAVFDPCDASQDPCSVLQAYNSHRTFLTFIGLNQDEKQTLLRSHYCTIFGDTLSLLPVGASQASQECLPARFVFTLGERTSKSAEIFHLSPEGDFVLQVNNAQQEGVYDLLCGLSGTEFIGFQPKTDDYPGDRLRFLSRQPAYAPNFPFQQASPVGPPLDPDARLLDHTYMTSWATVVRAPSAGGSIAYVAQPKGASLYGRDDLISDKCKTLFGFKDPSVALPNDGLAFPLVPYAGVTPGNGQTSFSKEQIEDFERQVIGPTRRQAIGHHPATTTAPSKMAALLGSRAEDNASYNATTPAGLLATVGPNGQWTKILLGQNLNPSQATVRNLVKRQMCFCNPDQELQQAFQTNQLFLVIASATHLGRLSGAGSGDCGREAAFYSAMNIEDWQFEAEVGQTSQYNDYTNVIIVKGRQGKLYDPNGPSEDNLVVNPEKWTQRADFASPTTADNPTPDPSQQVILSQWLQDYFQGASQQPDTEYFQKFNAIATDPNWTGILVLRMTIAEIPDDLAGITAGITTPERFNVHHFAIEISQVQNDPEAADVELQDSSSMFGLIYYVDPDFQPPQEGQPVEPVPPAAGITYDFRLLALKVLFENTAVRDFYSYAQITLNELFKTPVHMDTDKGGNPYNTIVLCGSYQNNDGQPVYSLGSANDNAFYFDSNVLNKVEVTSAQMSTRDSGSAAGAAVSWFSLDGFIDYKPIGQADETANIPASSPYTIKVRYAAEFAEDLGVHFAGGDALTRVSGTPGTGQYAVDDYSGTYTFSAADGNKAVEISCRYTFDLFSFGNLPSEDLSRRGLSFSNLGLQMSYPTDSPEEKTFEFKTDEITFDPATSTPRTDSLFTDFALQLEGLVAGTKDSPPAQQGYLPVITDFRLGSVDGGDWYGLRFRLDMGTPGELAGKVSLTSHLLIAWVPDSSGDNYKALVGIELPGTGGGAKLISLQNVLKLSIGQIRLIYSKNEQEPEKSGFLLMLTEIALKFLGLLKIPPSGSTLFYLFGNPESEGKPSGLGWYAMYRQKKDSSKAPAKLSNEEAL